MNKILTIGIDPSTTKRSICFSRTHITDTDLIYVDNKFYNDYHTAAKYVKQLAENDPELNIYIGYETPWNKEGITDPEKVKKLLGDFWNFAEAFEEIFIFSKPLTAIPDNMLKSVYKNVFFMAFEPIVWKSYLKCSAKKWCANFEYNNTFMKQFYKEYTTQNTAEIYSTKASNDDEIDSFFISEFVKTVAVELEKERRWFFFEVEGKWNFTAYKSFLDHILFTKKDLNYETFKRNAVLDINADMQNQASEVSANYSIEIAKINKGYKDE